jgi:hypothetical protein
MTPSGRHRHEGPRRVDLALEDLRPGRSGPQDLFLVGVAQRKLDELFGGDRRPGGIVLIRL